MTPKKLYDIQGTPIKVGSLVAMAMLGGGNLAKGRVAEVKRTHIVLDSGLCQWSCNCVVLEEPVWPNS